MTIRSPRLLDPSVRLPADLPAIDDVRSERAPEGLPEELRVGAAASRAAGARTRSTRASHADGGYVLAVPPPPEPSPPDALALLRDTAARIATSPTEDLAALRAAHPDLAAQVEPMLAAERALAEHLTRLVALRETVEAARRVALGEPR